MTLKEKKLKNEEAVSLRREISESAKMVQKSIDEMFSRLSKAFSEKPKNQNGMKYMLKDKPSLFEQAS